MILVFGRIADPIVASICARLSAKSREILLVDPGRFTAEEDVEWHTENGRLTGHLRIGSRRVATDQVDSVFIREVGRGMNETVQDDEDEAGRRSRNRTESIWGMVDAFDGVVINRRLACCTNASKPYQQRLIEACGFRVPRTLVTMWPEAARAFHADLQGRVIYKSISSERSVVQQMTGDDLDRLDALRHCPVQLQEMVSGIDVRVHTVEDRLFATEIQSDATDYRYAHREGARRYMRPVELPQAVATQCLRLATRLGLTVSGIDLRRMPDGGYCCFEVNPSPAFLWFEQWTGQRIGDAIVHLLSRGRAAKVR